MSFIWKRPSGRLRTPEQVAVEVAEVAAGRGLDDLAAVMALMCIAVESDFWCPANRADPESLNFPYDSIGDDNRSVGYFQQQKGPSGELWWGTTADMMELPVAAGNFFDRLSDDWQSADGNPGLAGEMVADVQRPAPQYRRRYSEKWSAAWDLFRRAVGGVERPVEPAGLSWFGDPLWLPEVLRAEGVTVVEMDGWRDRGHGDFGQIWGVVAHHTGSDNTPASEIAFHPELGLCSQIHLGRNGVATICGAGVAWHAGNGSWPGLPANSANQATIGIEAQNAGGGSPAVPMRHRSCWPDVQYEAYVRCVAAILRHLGHGADRVIAHREWAGKAQGKWDPGQIDMDAFRWDVSRRLNSEVAQQKDEGDVLSNDQDRMLKEIHQLLFTRFPSRSIYRNRGEDARPVWRAIDMIVSDDKFAHEDYVEKAARRGDLAEVHRIALVAAGEGEDTSEDAVAQAKAALSEIPVEVLQRYKDSRVGGGQ